MQIEDAKAPIIGEQLQEEASIHKFDQKIAKKYTNHLHRLLNSNCSYETSYKAINQWITPNLRYNIHSAGISDMHQLP